MTANRARSRAIRERMRATGVPYSVAARQIDQEREMRQSQEPKTDTAPSPGGESQ